MKHNLSPFAHLITSSGDETVQHRKATITLKLKIVFTDGSVLHIRENLVRETLWIDYSYHWQTATNELIHRWDNAHPVSFDIPYHQHIGSENNLQPSEPMTLEKVLIHIAASLVQ